MNRVTIPRTDITVSSLALGCWAFAGGGNWGSQNDRDSIAAVHAAVACGVDLLDTAYAYGDGFSEEIVGKAVKGRRSEVVIATKPLPDQGGKNTLEEACDGCLRRLQTDYIDLYQLHWPNRDISADETIEALESLKGKGKIRAWGVCNYGENDLGTLLRFGAPATNQLAYSLLWRAIEYAVLPLCRDADIGVLCYSPLAQALLTGKYRSANEVPTGRARTKHFAGTREQALHDHPGAEGATFSTIDAIRSVADREGLSMPAAAIGWLLAQPGVTAVIGGARNATQAQQNATAARTVLDPSIVRELTVTTEALKTDLGTNPDPWLDRMA